jgi:hypothetical protein
MEENENIYDKLQELFGTSPGSFNVLQEQIDVDLQMKYFELSRRVKKELVPEVVMEESAKLFKENTGNDKKKELLARLASVEEVVAFRTIEKFYMSAPEDLKEWAALAFQESKMMLESKFLDENQVLISTGLGGKGMKLRYFVVILGENNQDFTDTQKRIIKNEFTYTLQKHNSEVEDLNFSESMATVMAIVPMNEPVKAVFEEAVGECNTYGNFLRENFIITNVKELSFQEIKDFLKSKDQIIRDADEENYF